MSKEGPGKSIHQLNNTTDYGGLIEVVLNDRPLMCVSTDSQDHEPLTSHTYSMADISPCYLMNM